MTDHDSLQIPPVFQRATYWYFLPPELIAQEPSPERDASRLLVLRRTTGEILLGNFRDLPDLLEPSDLLVFNETKVVPAALEGRKTTGGRVDLLILDPAERHPASTTKSTARTCLVRSSKPIHPATTLTLTSGDGTKLFVEQVIAKGRVMMRFPVSEENFLAFLLAHGQPPLPPYIKPENRESSRDVTRYQTVYARKPGSIAAPTAGLHFTPEVLHRIQAKGVETTHIVLHVGPGTFVPVRENDIRRHRMESEFFQIDPDAAASITRALQEKRRIIAVGTTTVRALESGIRSSLRIAAMAGRTNLFIFPGFEFRVVGGLITNFHLPGSTLLMLVAAFAGTKQVLRAYETAISQGFRFYSYGDACFII